MNPGGLHGMGLYMCVDLEYVWGWLTIMRFTFKVGFPSSGIQISKNAWQFRL